MSPPFYIFFSRVALSWGFVSRQMLFSKSRISLKAPPPTTLIGALAGSFAIYKRMGEVLIKGEGKSMNIVSSADVFRRFVLLAYASISFTYAPYSDLNKIYWLYRGEVKSDAIALEKIYVYPLNGTNYPYMDIIYLVDAEKAESVLGDEWRKDVIAALWGLRRIGQKESVVSTVNVRWGEAKILAKNEARSRFYIPLLAVKQLPRGNFVLVRFVDHSKSVIADYTRSEMIEYIIPTLVKASSGNGLKVELSEEAFVVSSDVIRDDIIGLKRWLS